MVGRKISKSRVGKTSPGRYTQRGDSDLPATPIGRTSLRRPKQATGARRLSSGSHRAVQVPDLAVVTAIMRPRALERPYALDAPLEPREAFVLTRVDGETTIADLADQLGISLDEALAVVRKLVRLDLVGD
jgi:hypothetical protein